MDAIFIYNLKKPCLNRGVKFEDPKNGNVILDGKEYQTMKEAEDYLISKNRING
jgi:hypothetical protein